MIIFGSGSYFKGDKVNSFGECEHCGVYGKFKNYSGIRMGHLYWIPLIPLGGRSMVLRQCGKCKMGLQIPKVEARELHKTLLQEAKEALALQLGGRDTMSAQGEEILCMDMLYSRVDMLNCFGQASFWKDAIDLLHKSGQTLNAERLLGMHEQTQGNLTEAKEALERVLEKEPADIATRLQLAECAKHSGQPQASREAYERILVEFPDDPRVLLDLAQACEQLKDHRAAAKHYHNAIDLVPALRNDKAFKKRYTKLCKKAGETPNL